jgi:hypothetical protein
VLLGNSSFIMKSKVAVVVVTVYLVVVNLLANAESLKVLFTVFYLVTSAVLITMVVVILKDNSLSYPELNDQEWGYRDKHKNDLGLF